MQSPTLKLNDGKSIPQVGMGTGFFGDYDIPQLVRTAIEVGYRHFDTATAYRTDAAVGEGIRTSGAPREEIFLTSKLFDYSQGYEETLKAFDEDIKRIGLDYLDLYLIHFPNPEIDRYVDTWRAMIKLRDEGRIRSIGVSNFEPEHIDRLVAETGVKPAINQVELSPRFQQRPLRQACAERGVAVACWSPLVSGLLVSDPAYAEIARKHGRSPAQIVLRWHVQNGFVIVPKAEQRDWMEQNLAIFDFTLDDDDMARLGALDQGEAGRFGPHPVKNTLAERAELVGRIMAKMEADLAAAASA